MLVAPRCIHAPPPQPPARAAPEPQSSVVAASPIYDFYEDLDKALPRTKALLEIKNTFIYNAIPLYTSGPWLEVVSSSDDKCVSSWRRYKGNLDRLAVIHVAREIGSPRDLTPSDLKEFCEKGSEHILYLEYIVREIYLFAINMRCGLDVPSINFNHYHVLREYSRLTKENFSEVKTYPAMVSIRGRVYIIVMENEIHEKELCAGLYATYHRFERDVLFSGNAFNSTTEMLQHLYDLDPETVNSKKFETAIGLRLAYYQNMCTSLKLKDDVYMVDHEILKLAIMILDVLGH